MHLNTTRAFAFPILVADIGGTNARFAKVDHPSAPTEFLTSTATSDHSGIISAIDTVQAEHPGQRAQTAIIAVAGPVTGDRIPLTNADWVIEPLKMISELGLREVVVVNDFEAQALALPGFEGTDVRQFGGGDLRPNATKFVLGPGTGLGAGALIHAADTWIPLPGEGGHVELGPVSEEDYLIWPHIERLGGRIGAEQVLSGTGLPRLSRAVAAFMELDRAFASGSDVTRAAADGDPVAVKTVDVFARGLGRVAGDFALSLLARGGVYLTGGVTRHVSDVLTSGAFRSAFEAKAPHEGLLRSIPTFIVEHPNPALEGLAAFARAPSRFAVDMTGRRWTAVTSEQAAPA